MKPIVLHVSAEVSPYHKTGGLGDVLSGLPPALATLGLDVRVVTPRYRKGSDFAAVGGEASLKKWPFPLPVALAGNRYEATVYEAVTHDGHVTTYFVDLPVLSRGELYGYPDDVYRFALFGRAAIALAAALADIPGGGRVGLLHAHDWHGTFALHFARALSGPLQTVPTVLTIHNLAFQGRELATLAPYIDVSAEAFGRFFEDRGALNPMKAGILLADRVTTVSPTYAREITTPANGAGLDSLLRATSKKLSGITNGIDQKSWNPATDPQLPANYSLDDLAGKDACKAHLREVMGLSPPRHPDDPLLGVVSRLTSQKGIDWLCDAVPEFLRRGGQFVALGSGDEALQKRLHELAAKFKGSVAYQPRFEESLSRKIYGGCDLVAMPSRFEPCGISQLYAMRYGTIPVARATGGLCDTIYPLYVRHDVGGATGILYVGDRAEHLASTLKFAHEVARDRGALAALRRNAMRADQSWDRSAKSYLELYRSIGLVMPSPPPLRVEPSVEAPVRHSAEVQVESSP